MERVLDLVHEHRITVLAIGFIGFLSIWLFLSTKRHQTIPLINSPKWFEPTSIRAKLAFTLNARKWLTQGVETGKPFRVVTDIGELTVLPSRFARELRADPRLDFPTVIKRVMHRPPFSFFIYMHFYALKRHKPNALSDLSCPIPRV